MKTHKSLMPLLPAAPYSMTSCQSKDVILENCRSCDIHIVIVETLSSEKPSMKILLPTRQINRKYFAFFSLSFLSLENACLKSHHHALYLADLATCSIYVAPVIIFWE